MTAGTPRLFGREELRLRPTGELRLRRRVRADEGAIMLRLRARGAELAAAFGLRYRALEPERTGVNGHYGICYADGMIRIRLRHASTGKLLKESSLVDTLCHELAHLRHMNHGLAFRRLYRRILDRARALGHYRPGPERGGPCQASLFDDAACGAVAARGEP